MTTGPHVQRFSQDPTDDDFVQDPYAFYERVRREAGGIFFWSDYDLVCLQSYDAVNAVLRDRRFGREAPAGTSLPRPAHQAAFWAVEDHSMLELEAPRHTRLRGLVLRAFTSRRIAALGPEITALCHQLIDEIEARGSGPFDLIEAFAMPLPVRIIARLLGVPEEHAGDLLRWSHDMVGMYQASRTVEDETRAAVAAGEFSAFLRDYIETRRKQPGDDLLTQLIAAEEAGDKLSTDEMISTAILLLNAGHEATVHTIGNGVAAMLAAQTPAEALSPGRIDGTVEEIIRFDPALHMFTRWVYEPVEIAGHRFEPGDKVALLLGAANRDGARWDGPGRFDPERRVQVNASFGAGAHFCIGAPLARLQLSIALPILFERLGGLTLEGTPRFAPIYHFHGLERLMVRAGG